MFLFCALREKNDLFGKLLAERNGLKHSGNGLNYLAHLFLKLVLNHYDGRTYTTDVSLDAILAALLNTHGIDNLLTFNTSDFKNFGINAVSPDEILAQ
jgi:hypothetical protein